MYFFAHDCNLNTAPFRPKNSILLSGHCLKTFLHQIGGQCLASATPTKSVLEKEKVSVMEFGLIWVPNHKVIYIRFALIEEIDYGRVVNMNTCYYIFRKSNM